MLREAGDPRADSLVVSAQALLARRDLRKIPVMQHVHWSTIAAWLFGEIGEAHDGFDDSGIAAGMEDG